MRAAQDTATKALAGITLAAFVAAFVAKWGDLLAYAAGFISARVAEPGLLDHAGLGIPAVPVWLTPLSATLLHGGWMHLGFNLVTLLFCGRQVEMVFGPRLLLLLYAVGAYAAAAGQWLLAPGEVAPMVGASGAISAIIGAYALLYSDQKVRAFGPVPAHVVRMAWLGAGWVFLQFLVGLAGSTGGEEGMGQIAIGAHIGGFLAGMLMTRPLLRWRFRRSAARQAI